MQRALGGLLNEESSSRLTFIFNRMITRIRNIQSVTPGVWTLFCVAGLNWSQACSLSKLLLHNKELQAILWHIKCAQCREKWRERAPVYISFFRYIICLIDHSTAHTDIGIRTGWWRLCGAKDKPFFGSVISNALMVLWQVACLISPSVRWNSTTSSTSCSAIQKTKYDLAVNVWIVSKCKNCQ